MSASISLRALPLGKKATITAIDAKGELGRRIRDMGLMPGAEVEVVGAAPLKTPWPFACRGLPSRCAITRRII